MDVQDLPDRGELADPWPIECEVEKVKRVNTADTAGVGDPKWKLRLDPTWDEMGAFWTPQMDELPALPGDIIEFNPTGQTQASIGDATEQ